MISANVRAKFVGLRRALPPLAVAAAVMSCQERITAPGVCPDFCPAEELTAIDTLLTGVVRDDSTFRGYRDPFASPSLHLVTLGSADQTVGVLRFPPFPLRLDTGGDTVFGQDSFSLAVDIRRRNPELLGLELVVHRLPDDVDSSWTLQELLPLYDDSTVIGSAIIPDSQATGFFNIVMDSLVFDDKVRDRTVPVVGVSLRAGEETYVDIGAVEGAAAARLNRFVESDTTINRVDALPASLDGFVSDVPPPTGVGELAIGGAPSARSVLRFDVPSAIIDSADISRATLILVPTGPIGGASADSAQLVAAPVFRDAGRKSPTIEALERGLERFLGVGDTDTLFLEVTSIFRQWRAQKTLPRTLVLSTAPEGASVLELRISSSQGSSPPALRVTYVPATRFGQ